ncbi:MAG: SDR family oxidoreductase [Deltaproteobacteria bacterium]|nr:SDR family oxidoreductase [Deltaproteobacteria bacterium]
MPKRRHVVITGGGRGIGAEIARRFATLGDRITVLARTREEVEKVADEVGGYGVRCDVGEPASVEAAFMAAGPVDVLVNNAGVARSSPVLKTDVRVWDEHLKVNLTGAFLCSLKVLPGMASRGNGRIINVASVAGLKGYPYLAAYCASKHGLVGLTRALAAEYAEKGVTVNAICPGYVESPLLDHAIQNIVDKTGRDSDEVRRELEDRNPQHRFLGAEEIAAMCVYLASEEARGVNGQALSICGGELNS